MRNRTIPSYELYGELLAGGLTDPIHHETIRERSSQYDWTIRLHRHRNLAQVFLFRTPHVSFRLEDATHTTTGPLVLFIPPGVAHGFRFEQDVEGDVLSLRTTELGPGVTEALAQPIMQSGGILPRARSENYAYIETVFDQLGQIYHGMKIERSALLEALVQLVIAYVAGDLRRDSAVGTVGQSERMTRHEAQAEKFCALVEKNFASDLTVGAYAAEVGVSAPHLTRVSKTILGAAPNELVRQRRLLEAKRLLEYTRLSVSEVAHRSGFRDPSFFSRTFRQAFGASPRIYREEKDT